VPAKPVALADLVVKNPSEDIFGFEALSPFWSYCEIHRAGELLPLVEMESLVEMLQLLWALIWRQ
jgi:hypothetical protein